jgi:ATP synthase F1 epsilon subunit
MKTLHADIVTPDRKVFSGEIQSIQLPGSEGSFEVLYNHAPIVATLDSGRIRIKTAEGKTEYITQYLDREVVKKEEIIKYIEQCPVPKEIIDIHNQAVDINKAAEGKK